jgi:hypothetical protein
MVYAPANRPFKVHMGAIRGEQVAASWDNPRNGKATKIGEFSNRDP